MSERSIAPTQQAAAPLVSQAPSGLLQRQCACGQHTMGGECEECKKNGLNIQRRASEGRTPPVVPPIVHEVLRSSGRELDRNTRAYMEPRLGHDFSGVRVHTDSASAGSAHAVHALAYTVGQHVVFGAGRYQPRTRVGARLLAHELVHVKQQATSAPPDGDLTISPVDSAAETEARNFGDAIVLEGAARQATITQCAPQLSRDVEGAAPGHAAGGVRESAEKQSASSLRRIHELLSTGLFDWAVTDKEAREALQILRGLGPDALFDVATKMKVSGDWNKLQEELPAVDRLGLRYFTEVPLNPNSGYIMPGDTIKLEFSGGKTEEEMASEYQVSSTGTVSVPFLAKPVRVEKLFPEAAANAIVTAYTDALIYSDLAITLTPTKRGRYYSAFGQPANQRPFRSTVNVKSSPELARSRKLRRFTDYIKTVNGSDVFTANALGYYYGELNKNLNAYETPEQLWQWALKQASKPAPVSPAEPFLSLMRSMTARVEISPPTEQKRLRTALDRYMGWLDKHMSDPDLRKYDPVNIWSRAYLNAFSQEVKEIAAEHRRQEQERADEENWKKASAKFDDALRLMMQKVWAVAPARTISIPGEQLSEDNDRIKVSYLVQPSDAEKIIRDKIATEFMDDLVERMGKPGFTSTSATEDFVNWLNGHREENMALLLTQAHPDVEKFEDAVDIPAWQTAIETGVGFIPIVGNIVAGAEVISGQDMFGHPLTTTERAILGAAILLPAAAKIFKVAKAGVTVATIARDYRLSEPEARALFRATAGIKPGSVGARLLGDAAAEVNAGRPVKDPETLKKLDRLLRDMGMTEKETARALSRPGTALTDAAAQIEEAAERDIKSLGSMDGASEKMLKENPELRHALIANPLAADALKLCKSPCLPKFATGAQVRRLNKLLADFKQAGVKFDLAKVKEYLHAQPDQVSLGDAIDRLEESFVDRTGRRAQAADERWIDDARKLEEEIGVRERKPPDASMSEAREGQKFDREQRPKYPANEVPIKDKGGSRRRLDSYDKVKGEIVSRKSLSSTNGQIALADEFTMIDYFQEFALKYPNGAIVADGPLAGQIVKGRYILEVPVQDYAIPERVTAEAKNRHITIRDTNGKTY